MMIWAWSLTCAGVSKATIYTRWSTKYALVTDAATRRIEYIDIPDLGQFEAEVRRDIVTQRSICL